MHDPLPKKNQSIPFTMQFILLLLSLTNSLQKITICIYKKVQLAYPDQQILGRYELCPKTIGKSTRFYF